MSKLVDAVKNGDIVRVRELVLRGENVDLDPDDQGSPLHWAVCLGHMDIVNFLVQKGALVNRTTPWGMTPLHVAADMGNTICVSYLLSNGAKVDAQSHHRDTPLHAAAQRGFLEACRLLLKFGANISLKNNSGKTPVEEAKCQGHYHVANLLVKNGRPDGKNHTDTLYIDRPKIKADHRSVTTAPFYKGQSSTDPSTMRPLPVTSDTKRRDSFHRHSVMATNGAEGSQKKNPENSLTNVRIKGDTMTCNIMTDDGHIEEKVLNIPVHPTISALSHKDGQGSKHKFAEKPQNGSYDAKSPFGANSLGDQCKNHVKHGSSSHEKSDLVKPCQHSTQPEKTISTQKGLNEGKGLEDKGAEIQVKEKSKCDVSSRQNVPQQSKKEVDLQHQVMLLVKQRNMLEEYVEKLQLELTKRQDKIDSLRAQTLAADSQHGQAIYSKYVSLIEEITKKNQELQNTQAKLVSQEDDLKTCQKRLEVEIARSRHLAKQLFDLRRKLDENPTLYKCLMVAQASQTAKKLPQLVNKLSLTETGEGVRQTRGLSSGVGSGHGGRFVGRGLDSPEPSSPPPRPGTSQGAFGQSAPDLLAAQFAALGMGAQCTHESLYSALLPVFQSTGADLLGMMTKSLRTKVAETLVVDKNPLQNTEKGWILGEDYVLMDDSPLPESPEKNAAFFRIIHKDQLYILKVLVDKDSLSFGGLGAHSLSLPQLSSTSEHFAVQVPPHRNIVRILHQYCGSLEHVLHHIPQKHLLLPLSSGQHSANTTFYITEAYPMSLDHLIREYSNLNSQPPFGLPDKFVYQIVYEILSALCHLERTGLVHGVITAENVFLDHHMQAILGGMEFERKIIGAASVDVEQSAKSKSDIPKAQESLHKDPWDAARMMCSLFQSQKEAKAPSDDVIMCIPPCFPALLRHVMTSLLRDPREARITTRQAKVRVGIGLFGPGASEVTDLKQCEVWLQTKMMKLLVQPPPSTRHLPEGTMASVEISVELNHDWLERDFVTMVTAEELWEQYSAVRDYL